MADNKTLRGPEDRSRIDLDEDYEVNYWTAELGCTEELLRDAILRAGSSSVDKVRQALRATAA